jgi:hypothetical protein
MEMLYKNLNIPVHNLVINCVWVDKYSNTSHSGRGFSNKILVTFKPVLFCACHIRWLFLSGRPRVRFSMVSFEFFVDLFLPTALES